MTQPNTSLSEIVSALEGSEPISADTVKRWMESQEIESMGALMSLLSDEKHAQRIVPPLTLKDYFPFAIRYYQRSIQEDPNGEWSDSRTTAGWDFAAWFIQLWNQHQESLDAVRRLKSMLPDLYLKGNSAVRSAIVTSILEHLFQEPSIADYFADWKTNPSLASAFEEAKHLAELQLKRRKQQTETTS